MGKAKSLQEIFNQGTQPQDTVKSDLQSIFSKPVQPPPQVEHKVVQGEIENISKLEQIQDVLVKTIEEPGRLFNEGFSQTFEGDFDNILQGVSKMVRGLAQTAILPGTLPFNAVLEGFKAIGEAGENVASVAEAPFEAIPSIIGSSSEFIAQSLEAAYRIPRVAQNLALRKDTAEELNKAITELGTLATIPATFKAGKVGLQKLGAKVKDAKFQRQQQQVEAFEQRLKQEDAIATAQDIVTPREIQPKTRVQPKREVTKAPIDDIQKKTIPIREESVADLPTLTKVDQQLGRDLSKGMVESKPTTKDAGIYNVKVFGDRINNIQTAFKEGKITDRQKLKGFKTEITNYAQGVLPKGEFTKPEVKSLMIALKNAETPSQAKIAFQKINKAVENYENRTVRKDIKELLKPPLVKGGKKPRSTSNAESVAYIQNANKATKLSLNQAEMKKESIMRNIGLGEKTLDANTINQIHILDVFGGLKQKHGVDLIKAKESLVDIKKAGKQDFISKQARVKQKEELGKRALASGIQGKPIKDVTFINEKGQNKVYVPSEQEVINLRANKELPIESTVKEYVNDRFMMDWESNIEKIFSGTKSDKTYGGQTAYYNRMVHNASKQEMASSHKLQETLADKFQSFNSTGSKKSNEILRKKLKEYEEPKDVIINGQQVTIKAPNGKKTPLKLSEYEAENFRQQWNNLQSRDQMIANGWDQKKIDQLGKWIPEGVQKFGDYLRTEFFPSYHQRVNQVYKDVFGADLPVVENYMPKRSMFASSKDIEMVGKSADPFANIFSHHFLNRRRNKSAIKQSNIVTDAFEYIENMEHFIHWQRPITELKNTWASPEIKSLLDIYHPGRKQIILRYIDDFARGSANQQNIIPILDKTRINFNQAVLSYNLPLAFKQQASTFAYLTGVPAYQLAKGSAQFLAKSQKTGKLSPIAGYDNFKWLMDNSEWFSNRVKAGHTRDVVEYFDTKFNKLSTGQKEKVWRAIKHPTVAGDLIAVANGQYSTYLYELNKFEKQGKTGKIYQEKAMEKAEILSSRLQQSGEMARLSELQRSGSMGKIISSFMNSQAQYHRAASVAFTNLIKGKRGTRSQNLKTLGLIYGVLPMSFQFISDGFEFVPERQLKAILLSPARNIFVASMFAELAYDQAVGDGWKSSGQLPQINSAEQLGRASQTVIDDIKKGRMSEKDFMEVAREIAGALGKFTGKPIDPIINQMSGLYDALRSDSDLEFLDRVKRAFGFSEFSIQKKAKNKPLIFK